MKLVNVTFLNQVHAGMWPACVWFLKIAFVWEFSRCTFMSECLPLRQLITSGVSWHDMNSIRLVKQVLMVLYNSCSQYH